MIQIPFIYRESSNELMMPYQTLPEAIPFTYQRDFSFFIEIYDFLFRCSFEIDGVHMQMLSDCCPEDKNGLNAILENYLNPESVDMQLVYADVPLNNVIKLQFENLGVGIRTLGEMSKYTMEELRRIPLALLFHSISSWTQLVTSSLSLGNAIDVFVQKATMALQNETMSIAQGISLGYISTEKGLSGMRTVRGMTLGELAVYRLEELHNVPISFRVFENIAPYIRSHAEIRSYNGLSCRLTELRIE